MGFCHLLLILSILRTVEADKGLPKIKTEDNTVIRSNAGETVLLPCIVTKKDRITDPEWYKGEERIKSGAWDRYRATVRGLRIKDVTVDDAGVYSCQILDGFGFNSKITVRLFVSDLNRHQHRIPSWEVSEESTPIPIGIKPEIRTNPSNKRVFMAVGDDSVIRCDASGDPKPVIQWVKNGRPIVKHKISVRKNNERGSKLILSKVGKDDSGQYTCVAINNVGIANATFTIEVIEPEPLYPPPPEIGRPYPLNQTVEIGGEAIFQCRVKSETFPDIQWFKLIEKGQTSKVNITWEGRIYSVVKTPPITFEGITYVKNLTIRGVDFADEGIYLCLAGNRNGTHSKSAILKVRPRVIYRKTTDNKPKTTDNNPVITFISITALLGLVLFVMIIVCLIRCHRKADWTKPKYPPPLPKRPAHLLTGGTGLTGATSWISHTESPRTHAVCIHTTARPRGDLC